MFLGMIILGQIGLGWLFIRYIVQQDRGPKEPRKGLLMAGLAGVLAVPMAIIGEGRFTTDVAIDQMYTLPLKEIAITAILVGVIEEAAKSLPLAVFLYGKRYFDEITDGVIYFAIAGMVFGVVESIGYTMSFGSGTGYARIIMGPFLHASFCALFGLGLAMHKVRKWPILVTVAGAVLAVGAHAGYDFLLFYGAGWSVLLATVLAIVLNIAVFWLLKIAARHDAQLGISATGDNLYCRACGTPNPDHYLYCTTCGERT